MKLLGNEITAGILIVSQLIYGVPAYAEKYTSEASHRVHGRAPVASSLAFDKVTPSIGETITLTYVFQDLDGDLELNTVVQWLRDGQPIDGANALSYTLDSARGDRPGQRLTVEVTPKTDPKLSEPAVGQTVSLEVSVFDDPAAKPKISGLSISGSPNVGQYLTGKYTYDANGSGSTDASTYLWGPKDSTATGVGSGETIASSNEVPKYAIKSTDVGQVLELSVQAKNLANTLGNTGTVTTRNAVRPNLIAVFSHMWSNSIPGPSGPTGWIWPHANTTSSVERYTIANKSPIYPTGNKIEFEVYADDLVEHIMVDGAGISVDGCSFANPPPCKFEKNVTPGAPIFFEFLVVNNSDVGGLSVRVVDHQSGIELLTTNNPDNWELH